MPSMRYRWKQAEHLLHSSGEGCSRVGAEDGLEAEGVDGYGRAADAAEGLCTCVCMLSMPESSSAGAAAGSTGSLWHVFVLERYPCVHPLAWTLVATSGTNLPPCLPSSSARGAPGKAAPICRAGRGLCVSA